jgi:hypothetical protein
MEHTGRSVDVYGYSTELTTMHDIPIATAGTLWTDVHNGTRYILVFPQCIFFGDRLQHSLLNPNQLRAHGVHVHDVPIQFDPTSQHAIQHDELTIPLDMKGVLSFFESRKPTLEELDLYEHLYFTSSADWAVYSASIPGSEVRPPAVVASIATEHVTHGPQLPVCNPYASPPEFLDDHQVESRLIAAVHVSASYISCPDYTVSEPIVDPATQTSHVSVVSTNDRSSFLTAIALSKRWGISLEAAKATMAVSTQTAVRNIFAPSERKVRKKAPWLEFPSVKGDIYVDSMFSKVTGKGGFTGGSVYTNGLGYDRFYPWKRKGEHHDTLMQFIHDVGVPHTLISDNALEEVKGRARQTCTKYRINVKTTVPYSPWQNLAEASIRELKKNVRRTIRRTGTPLRLWAYCTEWCAAVRRLTASNIPQLHGRTPTEYVEGSTPDISSYALFDWYQPVYYLTPTIMYPHERKLIGRWIGVAETCVDDMSYIILSAKGKILIRKSVWSLTDEELKLDPVKERLAKLDETIHRAYGHESPEAVEFEDGDILCPLDDETHVPAEAEASGLEMHTFTNEEMDEYVSKELYLPRGGDLVTARVLQRTRDGDGFPTGHRNSNPILDTRQYEVEFTDGSIDTYTANVIAENMATSIDPEGQQYALFRGVIDHRYDNHGLDTTYIDAKGIEQFRPTTLGWELCVQWADGSSSWLPLADVKASNPVEAAEYAVSRSLDNEPAFRWWARKVLRKRDRWVCKIKTKYWKRSHKYGIELPKSVRQALSIDARAGTTFWRDAIAKEMSNVMPAFSFRDDDIVPTGYKKIDCHMIFDIKVDLTRKARLVAGGHQTEVPKESVYSSVVSRDSVRIALTIASLNDLEVLAADVQNAYLNAPTKEKCYTIAGPEFGPDNEGRPVLIVRALYGLRSSGARWRDHLADTIKSLGFKACLADGDVWLRPNVKPNGELYYEYVLIYVDDILAVSHAPIEIMNDLAKHYTLKEGSVRPPSEYLGSDIKQYTLPGTDGPSKAPTQCWSMSARTYITRAVTEVKRTLNEVGQRLKTKVATPMSDSYRAEIDTSDELDAQRITYFQGLIGVLRWIVELGRIDIMVAVTMLSSHLMAPRQGHLEQCFHIFAYLDCHENSTLVFDARYREVDESRFNSSDWSSFYPDATEAIPNNIPAPRGKPVEVSCYCDADHAGCRVTRRSHSGIILFVNDAPIQWYSKRQNTVESSTFGSEFVAMRIAVEQVEGLRYKLRMMGIPVSGPANMFCDNQSVFKNCSYPESTLKKKHNAIAYHRTREAQASKTIRVAWESGSTNLADILTKLLPGPRLRELSSRLLY